MPDLSSSLRLPVLLAVAVCLATAGCGADVGAGSADGDVVDLAVSRMASGVDPTDDQSSSYLRSYGAAEALMKVQPGGSVEPELAESVEQTAEREWTVTLRDGATFWSGDPVDANAVVASYDRARELSTLAKGLLTGLSMAAIDERTIVFTTKGPSPYFPFTLSSYALVIHNADAYSDADPTDAQAADLTGPYRVTGFETERSVSLEANQGWWGGEVGTAGVEVEIVPDAQSRAELALSGQADVVQDFPSARAEEAAGAGVEVVSEPGATTVAVYLNQNPSKAPALADQRVRQALAWAVDREEVVQLATQGLTVPLPSWLASSPGFPEATESGYTFDPERAAELLDQAGWVLGPDGRREKDGRPLSFRLLTFGAEAATGEVLQAQWAEVGVDAQVRNVEDALSTQALESGDWDAVTQAWTSLGNVPALLANQIGPDGAANHGGYEVPEVSDLLDRAATAPDEQARYEAALAVNEAIVEAVPLIPVHPRVSAVALADGVEGFLGHPLQYETIIRPDLTLP